LNLFSSDVAKFSLLLAVLHAGMNVLHPVVHLEFSANI